MNAIDKQLKLDTTMYRHKSFGRETYCNYCWVKCNGCIASPGYRSANQTCVKALCREIGLPFDLYDLLNKPSSKYYSYGLKKGDL